MVGVRRYLPDHLKVLQVATPGGRCSFISGPRGAARGRGVTPNTDTCNSRVNRTQAGLTQYPGGEGVLAPVFGNVFSMRVSIEKCH